MTDVTRNNATLTVTSSSGTTAPSAGTSQTWTVASLPAAFGAALGTGETLRLVDSTSGATTAQQAEIVLVTAMDGTGDTSITVTRGVEGSTPVAHSTGATFAAVVTKAVFDGYVSRAPAPSGGDDSAALQAALNTITNPGGKVILRPGVYHLDSTSLIANAPGLILEGYGAPAQSPLLGLGGTQLRVASGLWGFRYNMNDGGAAYAGPQLRNLAFYQGASGALGGVQITHAHNFSLQGVTAEGFDTGIGFDIELSLIHISEPTRP